ncbi:hypothetical protein [Phycicoccus sp.]|uniref:hypothetical protein n=1 Tax=Phycicoccus sp. TaxID=1902410 RepID=UPI002BBC7C92|nr:hypothetical protein [Phycicoccus sp.]HMM95731.1 hypothetical protein [Phycicoccus sp.]
MTSTTLRPRRPARLRLVVVLGLAVALVLQTAVAQAYVAVAYAQRGLVMTERPSSSPGEVRATLTLTLAAHEARLLRAESKSYNGKPDRNALGQKITCERPDGTIVKESWTGTNLLARDGLNHVVNRLLFVAPTAGTYLCRLRVYVNSHFAEPARATLYSGFVGDTSGTLTTQRLGVSRVAKGSVFFPSGDGSRRRVVPIFRYLPPPGATTVDARADIYITNCYGTGGAGCPAARFPPSGSSTYAVQGFLVPANPACKTVSTARSVRSFDSLKHHLGHVVDMTAKIPTGVDCGSWSTYTEVQWLAGIPFAVQLYPYSQSSIIGS